MARKILMYIIAFHGIVPQSSGQDSMVSKGLTMAELYRMVKENDADADAWFMLGDAHTDMGMFREAMENYNKVILLKPNHAMAYKSRGRLKAAYLQDYRGSIIDFSKALELDPGFSEAYFDRGLSRYFLQQYLEAAEDFSKVIGMDEKDSAAWFNRGRSRVGGGQKEEGCHDLSKAGELGYFNAYDWIRKYCN